MYETTSPTEREEPQEDGTREAIPDVPELYRLLLENPSLPGALTGLVQWVSNCLADQAVACGIALERPKRPILTAASDKATEKLMAAWLARDESPLKSVLGESISVIGTESGEPVADPETKMMALPIRLELGASAALVLRGPAAGPDTRSMLGSVGECRRAVSWVLRLATRYAHQCELAEHRAAAMESRTAIDIAIGVIMGQNRCSPEEAFEILKRASNARNRKLAEVARGVVASVSAADVHTPFED